MKNHIVGLSVILICLAAVISGANLTFGQKGTPTRVKKYEIYEITIKHDTRPYENPYQDVEVTVEFSHRDTGKKMIVWGFYYEEFIYKVRFMPLLEGRWEYEGVIKRIRPEKYKAEREFSGGFTCRGTPRNANHGPLRVHTDNPIWLVCDDGTPVYLNGMWSHSSLDATQIAGRGGAKWGDTSGPNFNKFADSAIGQGMIEKSGAPTDKYFRGIERRWDELLESHVNFLVITADHMGWGYQTASNWKGLKHGEFTEPFMYDEHAGKIWDYALEKAVENGIYIKMNIQEWCQDAYAHHPMRHIKDVNFGDEHPDDSLFKPEARKAWECWVKYLVSRYGAYANVHFQVGNEPPGNGYKAGDAKWKEFVTFLKKTVDTYNPYGKMFDEGGPTGAARTEVSSNRVFHDIFTTPSASAYYKENDFGKPYHFEEVADYPHTPLDGYLKSARYNKMACFIGGGYGTSLVMLSWVGNGVLPKYLDVCKRVQPFFDAFKDDLYTLRPDSSFIKEAPAEFCKGLTGDGIYALYMQRDDANIKQDLSTLPKTLRLSLPEGSKYRITWYNLTKGTFMNPVQVNGGEVKLTPPKFFTDDIGIKIEKK